MSIISRKKRLWLAAFAALTVAVATPPFRAAAPERVEIEPLLCARGKLLFTDDFEDAKIKPQWNALHSTAWKVVDGTLCGEPAPAAYQKSMKDKGNTHTGGNPHTTLKIAVHDCIVQLSFKMSGTMNGAQFGFNDGSSKEGTGHVCRLAVGRTGAELMREANSKNPKDESQVLAKADWKPTIDTWHHVLLEVRGDQFVAQVRGGPTLYGQNPRIDVDKSWINLPTRGGGTICYAHIRVWEGGVNPNWEKTRERLSQRKTP